MNAVLLNFRFNSKKKAYSKIWSSTSIFNIYNNQKCFLCIKSSYYSDFWRITEENSAL